MSPAAQPSPQPASRHSPPWREAGSAKRAASVTSQGAPASTRRRFRDNREGKPMSDSQAVTIPAAEHAATAETRPARLLRALAQNPEPLSSPALTSLLAEPGRRRRLLASYDRILHRHEQAGHVERAGRERKGRGRPPSSGASPPQVATGSTTTTEHRPSPRPPPHKRGARPPNGTRPWTKPAQLSTFRLRGSAANAPLTSSENSAAPSTRSARSSTSAKSGSARTSSGTRRYGRPHANPRERRSRASPSPPGKPDSSSTCTKATTPKTTRRTPTHSGR